MPKAKIQLPSVLKESTWFYKENEDMLKPFLGKPYISYSTHESYNNYFEDFVKQKIAGIKLEGGIYANFGTFTGTYTETGKIPDNPYGFEGLENLKKIPRPEGAEYERPVVIDLGEVFLIGFIDIFKQEGKKKEEKYKSDDYIQTLLYGYALEQEGFEIKETGVYFIRRENSHVNPPLKVSDEQFYIPLEYSTAKAKKAVKLVEKSAKEISELYKTYLKLFKQ